MFETWYIYLAFFRFILFSMNGMGRDVCFFFFSEWFCLLRVSSSKIQDHNKEIQLIHIVLKSYKLIHFLINWYPNFLSQYIFFYILLLVPWWHQFISRWLFFIPETSRPYYLHVESEENTDIIGIFLKLWFKKKLLCFFALWFKLLSKSK